MSTRPPPEDSSGAGGSPYHTDPGELSEEAIWGPRPDPSLFGEPYYLEDQEADREALRRQEERAKREAFRRGGTSRGSGVGSSWDSPVLDSARRKYEIERQRARGNGGAALAVAGLLALGGLVYAFSLGAKR